MSCPLPRFLIRHVARARSLCAPALQPEGRTHPGGPANVLSRDDMTVWRRAGNKTRKPNIAGGGSRRGRDTW